MFVPDEHKEAGEAQEVKPLDEVSKLLLKAAALIEERGLCKNGCYTDGRSLCAIAALYTAEGISEPKLGRWSKDHLNARNRLRRLLTEEGITSWNDAPGRTKEEVVAKLRAVALGG